MSAKSVASLVEEMVERLSDSAVWMSQQENPPLELISQCKQTLARWTQINGSSKESIQKYVDLWNTFANNHGLSQISRLTAKRISHLRQREHESDFDFDKILKQVAHSSFLLGRKTRWTVTFDWLISSKTNYVKVLEGQYNDRSPHNVAFQRGKYEGLAQ